MGITHAETLAGYSDDGSSGVSKDEWNAPHVVDVKLDDLSAPDDNTDLNASTSAHGLLKKLDNDPAHFLNGQGSWATPAGGSGDVATDAIWDAKGDLAVGSGANTGAKLTVGADGTVPVARGASTAGIEWAAGWHPGNRGTLPPGAIAENLSRQFVTTNLGALTSGTLRLVLIWLPVCTVTSITWFSATTAYSGGGTQHMWSALYDSSLNLLQQSTDDTSPTWSANSAKTFTLASTQAITTPGLYYAGLLISVGSGSINTMHGPVAPSTVGAPAASLIVSGNSSTGLGGTAPNPAAAITSVGGIPYVYVS